MDPEEEFSTNTFGEMLEKLRNQAGYSQTAFGNLIQGKTLPKKGVSRGTIENWEKGDSRPERWQVIEIIKVLRLEKEVANVLLRKGQFKRLSPLDEDALKAQVQSIDKEEIFTAVVDAVDEAVEKNELITKEQILKIVSAAINEAIGGNQPVTEENISKIVSGIINEAVGNNQPVGKEEIFAIVMDRISTC